MIVRFSVASCLHIHKQQIYKNINNRLAKYEIKLFFNPIQDRGIYLEILGHYPKSLLRMKVPKMESK